ncbi:MAG: response regulator [Anaerolineae bacterium]|nr:MAG: response regulator [Anaerolineae bacterium]
MAEPLVLIVDDEKGLLDLFCTMLRPLNLRLLTAEGGAQAIALLEQITPDLLILDLAMPQISGYDVLNFVKQTPRLDRMRVMVLTATGPLRPTRADDPRIARWVTKPVASGEFRAIVQALISEQ